MAKPFLIPAWRQVHINNKYDRKHKVIARAVVQMESVMEEAVDSILLHYSQSGQFKEPGLKGMFAVSSHFYENVVTQAFKTAKEEKLMQPGKKRLAAPGPLGLPKSFRDLEKIFRDRRYWPKIMKRSQKLTERLRRQYISKLRRKFEEVIPKLISGVLTPKDVKNSMMDTWHTSKSRVETIFRTETTTYFGKTQTAFFEGDEDIIGFLFDSVRDTARTVWCKERHGLIYRPGTSLLTQNTPACHWNCRSHLIALANTPYNRKLLEDPKRDPSKVKVTALPHGWRK